MKIYKIYETSYNYGDEEESSETIFTSSTVRDNYFKHIYKESKKSTTMFEREEETTDNNFVFDDSGKWSYHYQKMDEDLNIVESFIVDSDGLATLYFEK